MDWIVYGVSFKLILSISSTRMLSILGKSVGLTYSIDILSFKGLFVSLMPSKWSYIPSDGG